MRLGPLLPGLLSLICVLASACKGDGGGESDEHEGDGDGDTTGVDADTTADDTGTETADGETGSLECAAIEAEYESLVAMTDCQGDDQCKIVEGHCGVGLGGCDYAVNGGVDEAWLAELAQAWVDADCTNGVCDCAPPPASAACMDGACVGVN